MQCFKLVRGACIQELRKPPGFAGAQGEGRDISEYYGRAEYASHRPGAGVLTLQQWSVCRGSTPEFSRQRCSGEGTSSPCIPGRKFRTTRAEPALGSCGMRMHKLV